MCGYLYKRVHLYGARSEGHGEYFLIHGKDLCVHRIYHEHVELCLIG